MKLTMLGTGNALVTHCYNTCFVLQEGDHSFLVDGGGGIMVLSQLEAAGIDWRSIRDIFVTHKHIDHILGIVWMVRLITHHMKNGDYEGEARIYGHDEVIDILRNLCTTLLQPSETAFFETRLHLIPVEDGEEREIMGHRIVFFDIHSTKAKQFGFTYEYEEGKRLTCCGDEPYSEPAEPYMRGSRWLLHEAFCLHSEADFYQPYEMHHSTVKDASETAKRFEIPNLLLYHTEDSDIAHRKERYEKEGKQYYDGHLIVPDDLEVIEL